MSTDKDNYIAIDCGLHSRYELVIMHKTRIVLCWINSDNSEQTATVEPVDLISKDKQEFLKVKTIDNVIEEIRLDKIMQFTPVEK